MADRSPAAMAAALAGCLLAVAVMTIRGDLGHLLPELLRGALVTVRISAGGALVAVTAALSSALLRLYAPAPFAMLATAYVELFRGTSALVQLFWLFFVLPHFGLSLEPLTVGIAALGLNIGAYGSEVIRGAITAVDPGQWEAARALGMSRLQTLRRVILPQAFPAMLPPWGNLFIELLKATALVSLITLSDLTFKAQQLNQTTLRTAEIFTLTLLLYLALSLLITMAMQQLEHRAGRNWRRGRPQ